MQPNQPEEIREAEKMLREMPPAAAEARAEMPPGDPSSAETSTAPPEASPDPGSEVQVELARLREELGHLNARADAAASLLAHIAETQELGAEQLRRFGRKLDQVATVVADSRLRELANGLLLYYDLLAGLADSEEKGTPMAGRPFRMLLGQLQQTLTASGIQQIPADGPIDYQVHRAVKQVAAETPAQAGQIVAVWRAGFRYGGQVLRPADVVVAAAPEVAVG